VIEFAPTVEDEIARVTEAAGRSGDSARSGCFLVVIGFAASVLIGAWSGREVAVVTDAPLALGGWIGLACGTVLGVVVVTLTPRLRGRLVQGRIERVVRRAYRRSGRVQLWLDRDGLNLSRDGVHTHLLASAFAGATQFDSHVLWRWSVPGADLSIPKRVGPQINELGWTLADLKARGGPAAASHGLDLGPRDRPDPGSLADLTVQLGQEDLVALARLLSGRPSPERRDQRRISAGRGGLWGFVLTLPAAPTLLPALGAWVLVLAAGAAVVLGVAAWWSADTAYLASARRAAELTARGLLAASGQERRLWLDGSGVGCADAVVARHVEWAALRVVETRDRYFLITPDASADMVIPRGAGRGADRFVAAVRAHSGSDVSAARVSVVRPER